MAAALDDFTINNDKDLIGIANRAQSVGDHETCATFHKPKHCLLNCFLGASVDATRRFVEDEDGGIGEDGASDCQELTLTLTDI